MGTDNNKTSSSEWVKNFGTFLVGVATVAVTIVLGITANVVTRTQIELNDINAKSQMEITERKNENDLQLKSIEIFLELIKGNSQREKEMAVQFLRILDEEMAFDLAISIATNKSEDRDIALAAFRIGKQIDSARFLENILKIMNISLSDNNSEAVRGYLRNPDSGYQQLAEVLYIVLDRSTLAGRAVPLDNINNSVLRGHSRSDSDPILEVASFNKETVKSAILTRWREKNRASRLSTFDEIIY
jgi:hypothetical protein